jgi:hypothetical protein
VAPVFCLNNSYNKLNISYLHFKHIYQSVTANRPFCPLFGPKKRSFHSKYSPFSQFRNRFCHSRSNSNPLQSRHETMHIQ